MHAFLQIPFVKAAPMVTFRKPIGSVSVSGHKFVGAPVPCGVVITRMRYVMALSRSASAWTATTSMTIPLKMVLGVQLPADKWQRPASTSLTCCPSCDHRQALQQAFATVLTLCIRSAAARWNT